VADPQAEPSRDRGHEALRQDILAAVADLQLNTGDVQSGLELSDLLFQFIGQLLDSGRRAEHPRRRRQLREQTEQVDIDALQQRVAALETLKPRRRAPVPNVPGVGDHAAPKSGWKWLNYTEPARVRAVAAAVLALCAALGITLPFDLPGIAEARSGCWPSSCR
jgi:hypothetical protein